MNSYRHLYRLSLVALIMIAVFGALGARLAYLHLEPHEADVKRLQRTRSLEMSLEVGRGIILDRTGALLSMNGVSYDVCANPSVISPSGHARFIAMHLSRLLNLDVDETLVRLSNPDRQYVRLKRFVDEDAVNSIRRLQLKGLWFPELITRQYPGNELMCHVLGFVNWEGDPSGGIEQVLNEYLEGRPGLRISERNMRGEEIYGRRSLEIAPREGADITLTLDRNVQIIVEEVLDELMLEFQPLAAWALVQRVNTGEILAMASRPAFNLNEFRHSSQEERRNRTIGVVFEPGSTFKFTTIAGALDHGIVNPENRFDCENGLWYYGGRSLRDFSPHGILTVAEILQKSSNIGTAKIALRMGNERLEEVIRAFGFGRAAGIELPGEEAGIVHPRRQWSAISATRLAMGHEVSVTALQLINAFSATVNGGNLMRPAVIARVVDEQGRVIYQHEPEVIGRPISEETSRTMRRLLEGVADDEGTGHRARVDGYRIGGKTGTAQKAVAGGYSSRANISSFIGFLPVDNPELAILVVVDEPGGAFRTGGFVAAPAFGRIAEQTVRYLGILPDNSGSSRLAGVQMSPRGRISGADL